MSNHFFIVGAQRSGTTYLYQVLDEHPEIEMNRPARPEPKFFLKEGSDQRIAEYEATFFSDECAVLRGDKSTSYLESSAAAERIARCFPDTKILIMLRDPVDRAVSNYWFSVANNFEHRTLERALLDDSSQEQTFDSASVSVSPFAYRQRGRYVQYIDHYARCFSSEQIKIIVFEKCMDNLDAVQELYAFLGVTRDFVPPSLHEKVNDSVRGLPGPSAELARSLREYFTVSNQQLAQRYGVDVSLWG